MTPRRAGFTLIELLIVIVIIGLLATFAQTFLWKARDRAIISTMKSDLKVLATQQEIYFAQNLNYATDPTLISDFHPSPGVVITINAAQPDGWAGDATHTSISGVRCGLFIGNASAADAQPATRPGVAECD